VVGILHILYWNSWWNRKGNALYQMHDFCILFLKIELIFFQAKDLFERGLTQVGVNVSRGSLLWEAYRELEMATLTQTTEVEELVFFK